MVLGRGTAGWLVCVGGSPSLPPPSILLRSPPQYRLGSQHTMCNVRKKKRWSKCKWYGVMHYTRCIEKWYGQQEEDPFFRQKSWNLNDGCRSIAIPLFLMFSKSFGMGKVVSRQLRSRLTCSLFSLWGIWWSMKDGEESERATVYSHPCPFKSHWVSSVLRPSWHSSNTHTHT